MAPRLSSLTANCTRCGPGGGDVTEGVWHSSPHEKVELWMWGYENMSTSVTRQLWIKLRRFVLGARWTGPGRR